MINWLIYHKIMFDALKQKQIKKTKKLIILTAGITSTLRIQNF